MLSFDQINMSSIHFDGQIRCNENAEDKQLWWMWVEKAIWCILATAVNHVKTVEKDQNFYYLGLKQNCLSFIESNP